MSAHKNSNNIFNINVLALLALFCAAAFSAHAAENTQLITGEAATGEQLLAFRQRIEDLEYEFGPYHPNLIEPLTSMIALVNEAGDYEQVAELQDRKLQVMRTELGFEHPDLIPLIREMVDTQKSLRNWEGVTDNLEHIRHIQASQDNADPDVLLQTISDQIDWLNGRIAVGQDEDRVDRFFEARDLYEDMEDLVESRYEEDSIESLTWLYKQAYNSYQLVQFLNTTNGIGRDFIKRLTRRDGTSKLDTVNRLILGNRAVQDYFAQVPAVHPDEKLGHGYMRDAYAQINEIADSLQEGDDLEAQAMAELYRGDYKLLASRSRAMNSYRDAYDLFLAAGLDEAEVRSFFQRPMIIPMEEFHSRLKDAVAEQDRRLPAVEPVTGEEFHLGTFTAWNEVIPTAPIPLATEGMLPSELNYNTIDLRFSVNSRGEVSTVKVVESDSAEREVGRRVWRQVRAIQFRPSIEDGKAKRVRDIHMRFRYIEEQ